MAPAGRPDPWRNPHDQSARASRESQLEVGQSSFPPSCGTPQNRLRKKGNAEAERNPAAAESSVFIKADVAEILRSYLVMITDQRAWCMGGVFGATAWLRLTATYTRAKIMMIRPASTAKGVIRPRTSTCFGCA